MKKALFLFLCLAGVTACGVEMGGSDPDFKWDFGTHPEALLADGTTDPVWTDMVETAREKWSVPLAEAGCPDPFRGNSKNPVYLIAPDKWGFTGYVGSTQSWGIVIEGTVDSMIQSNAYESVLPHELGHALGLKHVIDGSDPDSIMHTPADHTVPSAKDLEHVREILGC